MHYVTVSQNPRAAVGEGVEEARDLLRGRGGGRSEGREEGEMEKTRDIKGSRG